MLYPKQTRTRCVTTLDGVWDFRRELDTTTYENGFTSEKQVAVPASYNDLFTEHEFRTHLDGVWYQRRFFMPRAMQGERVLLRFQAVSYRAKVFLNGTLLGAHETGYTPFEFDVTERLSYDEENLLVLRIDTTLSAETIPQGNLQQENESGQISGQFPDAPFDFFPYGGIHRSVFLYTVSAKASLTSLHITTEVDGDVAHVRVRGDVSGSASTMTLRIKETDARVTLSGVAGAFDTTITIANPTLWDVGEPNLYHVTATLFDGNVFVDEYTERFGVRTVSVDCDRLLLNGKPIYLKGFGKHEDFHIIGKGHNDAVMIRDFELMEWVGANSFRTSHYPYADEVLNMADERGFLVIAEAPAVSLNFKYVNEKTLATHQSAMRELVLRDRNHPSVIMWSVANESTAYHESARPYFQSLYDLTKELDATRPVSIVTCFWWNDVAADIFDVVGVNTYPGWYTRFGQIEKAKDAIRTMLPDAHERFGKPVYISEFGADTIAGVHALPAEQWTEEYQTELLLALIDEMRAFPFNVGEHIWNFADFRTSQHNFRAYGNRKGVFTRERQPKMLAHFLRKKWRDG